MSEFLGQWPNTDPPWDVTANLQPSKTVILNGPSGTNQEILAADPNRVSVWIRLLAAVAASVPLVSVRYPGTSDLIGIQHASANDVYNFITERYYYWHRHGPLVQGQFVWTTANADQVTAMGVSLIKWPTKTLPRQIVVPPCPKFTLPTPNGASS